MTGGRYRTARSTPCGASPAEGSGLVDYGTLLTADADPSQDGLQVSVTNGAFSFEVEFDSPNGAYSEGRAIVYSTTGTAFGDLVLKAPVTGGQQ
ncbi:MAG: hypothetical protein QM736_03605 [Vicinamibacterales bacterium]